MFSRRILLHTHQMANPHIYSALRKDNVENWVDHGNGIAEVSDFSSNDFPHLRAALETSNSSYRFHVIDTLGGKVIFALHSVMGFVTSGGDHGITDEQIASLLEAKA